MNFSFLSENDHTYTYETYYGTSSHALRSGELSSSAIIRQRHFVTKEQWVGKAGVLSEKYVDKINHPAAMDGNSTFPITEHCNTI